MQVIPKVPRKRDVSDLDNVATTSLKEIPMSHIKRMKNFNLNFSSTKVTESTPKTSRKYENLVEGKKEMSYSDY